MRLKIQLVGSFVVLILTALVSPAFAQDEALRHIWQQNDTLLNLSIMYNVCMGDLRAANPDLKDVYEYSYLPLDEIVIPEVAQPCYKILTTEQDFQSVRYNILDHFDLDICVEALFRYSGQMYLWGNIYGGEHLYIPVNEPPCHNAQGERLQYFTRQGTWLKQPEYVSTPYYTISNEDFEEYARTNGRIMADIPPALDELIELKNWCPAEVYQHNPFVYMLREPARGYTYIYPGMDIFLPEDKHTCKPAQVRAGQTLFDVAREHNVCVEAILAVTNRMTAYYAAEYNLKIEIPADAFPCYDQKDGRRLAYADKGIHKPESGEALYDVALMYDVCVGDLIDANPFLNRWSPSLPLELFIPDKLGCADNKPPSKHIVVEGDTIHSLSITYNICLNRIYEANQTVEYENPSEYSILNQLRIGTTLLIPTNRPDCYTLERDAPLTQEHYICYAEAVDMEQDYTGHEPPISPLPDTNSDFCHEYGEYSNLTIYNNEKLLIYQTRSYDTTLTIAQCFDVPVETLIEVNAQMYPTEVRGNGEWIIPEPYDHDCYLLTADSQTYQQRVWAEQNQAGSLGENGVYIVNYGDTLSAIGRRFGYLPEWIAAENNLSSPDMIYHRQQLKLPQHVTLYDMAKIGGVVGGTLATFVVLGGLYRWRTGGKRKRKNVEKAKTS